MSLIVHVEIEINIFCPENFFFIFVGKGLFTRRSDFALNYPILLNMKIIIFWRTDQVTGKSRSEIGRVNKP